MRDLPIRTKYRAKHKDDIHIALKSLIPTKIKNKDVYFVCIGTDRSTGDSLAPMIGTELKRLGYTNLVGTLEDPVHAMNLQETIDKLPKDKVIIAIDAALGRVSSVGEIDIFKGQVHAGAGVNKELPPVGDYGINGVVNVGGFMEYFVLQNTRLNLVMNMANEIVGGIKKRFPVRKKSIKKVVLQLVQ